MNFLKKIFAQQNDLTEKNINEKIKIGAHFYLMKYSDHYATFLDDIPNKKKVIAELFVFRAWTTQFGFRVFSSQPALSEIIIGEVFNEGQLGKGIINQIEQVNIEAETGKEYEDLIDSRWQDYDKVFIANKNTETPIPTRQICGKLTELSNIKDPEKFLWICMDFVKHLETIKREALQTGLLK